MNSKHHHNAAEIERLEQEVAAVKIHQENAEQARKAVKTTSAEATMRILEDAAKTRKGIVLERKRQEGAKNMMTAPRAGTHRLKTKTTPKAKAQARPKSAGRAASSGIN